MQYHIRLLSIKVHFRANTSLYFYNGSKMDFWWTPIVNMKLMTCQETPSFFLRTKSDSTKWFERAKRFDESIALELFPITKSSYQSRYQSISSHQTTTITAAIIDIFTATKVASSAKTASTRWINTPKDFTKQSSAKQLTFTFRKYLLLQITHHSKKG